MIDIQDRLLPNEKVQYQFEHPLWVKALATAAMLVVGYLLFEDTAEGRYLFVVAEVLMLVYIGAWLRQMLLDTGQYFVTDQRVLRVDPKPEKDQVVGYGEISEARLIRDRVSGIAYVTLTTADGGTLRIPTPSMGRSKAEELVDMINRNRGMGEEER